SVLQIGRGRRCSPQSPGNGAIRLGSVGDLDESLRGCPISHSPQHSGLDVQPPDDRNTLIGDHAPGEVEGERLVSHLALRRPLLAAVSVSGLTRWLVGAPKLPRLLSNVSKFLHRKEAR